MKIYASFYDKGTRKSYAATALNCDNIDGGIAKVKRYLVMKNDLHMSDMINKDYQVR